MLNGKASHLPPGGICGGYSSTILWAWAKDAPTFKLPEDVGFKVGPGTKIDYLVLQVHYKSASIFKGMENLIFIFDLNCNQRVIVNLIIILQ